MKIAICSSMAFSKEILETKKELEKYGHEIIVPANTDEYANNTIQIENKWEKMQFDVIRKYHEKIKNSDAILIINKDKNDIENYIGGNSLIEMAFAHVLIKKIFLLNPIPDMSYSDEITAMKPIIINNNLTLIQ